MSLDLTQEEKELLIRAFSHYYESFVWEEMVNEDSNAASNEDYKIRTFTQKLGIRGMFPTEIKCRW